MATRTGTGVFGDDFATLAHGWRQPCVRAGDTFPWVFPQLYHIYQWHLAIAGNQAALKEIAAMDRTKDLALTDPS